MPGGAALADFSPAEAIAVLACFNVVVFGIGLRVFSSALEYARRMGLLAGY
jgi:hypothetical protein